jgi:hypothetical protein
VSIGNLAEHVTCAAFLWHRWGVIMVKFHIKILLVTIVHNHVKNKMPALLVDVASVEWLKH